MADGSARCWLLALLGRIRNHDVIADLNEVCRLADTASGTEADRAVRAKRQVIVAVAAAGEQGIARPVRWRSERQLPSSATAPPSKPCTDELNASRVRGHVQDRANQLRQGGCAFQQRQRDRLELDAQAGRRGNAGIDTQHAELRLEVRSGLREIACIGWGAVAASAGRCAPAAFDGARLEGVGRQGILGSARRDRRREDRPHGTFHRPVRRGFDRPVPQRRLIAGQGCRLCCIARGGRRRQLRIFGSQRRGSVLPRP